MATSDEILTGPCEEGHCWQLDCSGSFMLTDDQGAVPLRGRKARAIVAYLAAHKDEHVARDRLIELLWCDRGEVQARGSLRQSLREIRQAAPDLLESDHDHVWIASRHLSPADGACAVREEERLNDLDGITPEFDEWLRHQRSVEAAEQWSGLQTEVEELLSQGHGRGALPLIERMQHIDPYNEDWLRLAMRAECQAGHPAGVHTRFSEFDALCKHELGVPVSGQTKALHDELLQELAAPATSETLVEKIQPVHHPRRRHASSRRRRWLPTAGMAALITTVGLTQSAQTASAQAERVAVLPFAASIGVDPALAEGLSDELLAQLSQQSQLRVIGPTTASRFKDASDPVSIGRKLRAAYLVDGKVTRTGENVRVLVSLVRGSDGSLVWARNFTGAATQLQPIPASIGAAVAGSLGVAAGQAPAYSTNGEAYALYVRARGLMRERNSDAMSQATELLRQAIKIDPNFAAAWATLAEAAQLWNDKDVVVDLGGKAPMRMTKRQAAERALALDPTLAEAHAAMALVDRLATPAAREHLRMALQLRPGDTQTLYWWAITQAQAGDNRSAAQLFRRTASLDPLWKRPVTEAAKAAFDDGRPEEAMGYLRTIKAGNPEAAREVEIDVAFRQGDFSKVVQIAFADPYAPWDGGRARAVRTLMVLGFTKEAALLGHFSYFGRELLRGHTPAYSEILAHVRNDTEEGDDLPIYSTVFWRLAREGRCGDVAAIYDADLGMMHDLRGNDAGGRASRLQLGPIVALCLNVAGRRKEAVRLALATADAAKVTVANGSVPPDSYMQIAASNAILGHRDQALSNLEKAFAMGWRIDEFTPTRISGFPPFATLIDDPRFARLQAIQDAHINKERRDIMALGII